MGNIDNLTVNNTIWPKIKQVLEDDNAIGNSLELRCHMHPENITHVNIYPKNVFYSIILTTKMQSNYIWIAGKRGNGLRQMSRGRLPKKLQRGIVLRTRLSDDMPHIEPRT